MLCTVASCYGVRDGMFTVFFFFSSASVMAMTSIAKSINIAIAILLKRSIGIAIAITFATSIAIAIAIVLSSIAYNPGLAPPSEDA